MDRVEWNRWGQTRYGERKEIFNNNLMSNKVLRDGEKVDRFGNVVEEELEGGQDRRKRRRSGGSSPNQAKEKRGKVQAADFGKGVRVEERV